MFKFLAQTQIKSCLLALACFSSINFSLSLKAETINWEISNQEDNLDFSENGRPKRTAGGASRGECQVPKSSSNLHTPLTALIPDKSVALTANLSPRLWFYIPYNLSSKHSAELVLKDNLDNLVYQNKFPGTKIASGIVSLSFPSDVILETDRDYDWYFLIYCDRVNKNRFVYVKGSVKRVEISASKMESSEVSQEEKLTFYTEEKIWYEALDIVAQRMQNEPNNQKLRSDWITFLQSINLDHLVDESR